MNGERGQALPLAVIALALGMLVIAPFLGYASSHLIGSGTYRQGISEQYAADAGVEYAVWQLKYNGLAESFTTEEPTRNDAININGMTVNIAITRVEGTFPPESPPPLQGPQSWRVQIAKSVEPDSAPLGQQTIFTYALYISNVGTSEVHLEEVRDLLPAGFVYTGTISGLITTAQLSENLVDGQWELVWTFPTPQPSVGDRETATQVFQATATLNEEVVYWNAAWVTASPESIGEIGTGSTAPVGGGGASPYMYDIVSDARETTIRARASINDAGVYILSWQVEQ